MYQMFGSVRPRCMSFESSGLPLAVCLPAITQLFEPAAQPSQAGRPSSASSARGSIRQALAAGRRRAAVDGSSSSSSSSLLRRRGSGCGWLRSSTHRRSADDRATSPPDRDRPPASGLFSLAAIRSRDSFVVPMRVQHLHHHQADAHRVHAAPRLRPIASSRNSAGSES